MSSCPFFRFALTWKQPTIHAALLEGFKTPRLASDVPFTSLRELSDFNAEHNDSTRFVQTRGSSPRKTT
jgi:hypothetical protein